MFFFVKRKDSPYPFGWNKEKYGSEIRDNRSDKLSGNVVGC